MPPLLKYYGVSLHRSGDKTRWRTQLIRRGVTLHLGTFEDPQEAAKTFDNASVYLAPWGNGQIPRLNYPEDWPGLRDEKAKNPEPSMETKRALETLRKRFPDHARDMERVNTLEGIDAIEADGLGALANIERDRQTVRRALTAAISHSRILEARLNVVETENTKLKLTIEGLRVSSVPSQHFVKINGASVPSTPVDSHLDLIGQQKSP